MISVRSVTAFGLAVLPVAAATAQDKVKYSNTPVFTFLSAPGLEETKNANDLTGTSDLKPRPNNSTVVYLYVKNPTANAGTFIVEMKGGPSGAVLGRATISIPDNTWKRVRFAKPAPATPPPAPAPAATPPAAPPEPPPPGTQVGRGADGFPITLRLLDDKGNQLVDGAKEPYGLPAKVVFADPSEYLAIDKPDAKAVGAAVEVTAKVTAKGPPPSTLKLSFPTPDGGKPPILGDGVYTRTLTPTDADKTPSASLVGLVRSSESNVVVHFGADGVERVKVYNFNPTARQLEVNDNAPTAVRVYAVTPPKDGVIRPSVFPVRVEVDKPAKDATLELHVRRTSDKDSDAGKSEVIRLGGPREEKLWVDVSEPNGEGIAFATKSSDWVVPVNLADARGDITIVGTLRSATTVSGSTPLRVDAYPPKVDALAAVGLKDGKQLVKGKPLTVRATGTDAETKVARAIFFLGLPAEDGKLPETAVAGKLEVDDKGKLTGAWVADLPIAADKRGETVIGVVFVDQAGNVSDPRAPASSGLLRIELVDPPPPPPVTGKIDGIVMIGERPQPGVIVNVEGGIKVAVVTNASGKFCVQGLLPGNYKVSAAKTDVTTGVSGVLEVGVLPDKKTMVILELKKNK